MFGFSLFKIIFTIVVVVVVWNAFKYFSRIQDQREQNARVNPRKSKARERAAPPADPPADPGPSADGIEDMVECKVCHAYVTRGGNSCGKDNCPFQG